MTTNFRKFRKQSRLSFAFMLLTAGASYRRIDKGEAVECVHCGAKIETA